MYKSKIRNSETSKQVEDRYYEVAFLTIVTKTCTRIEEDKLLQKWCELAHTDYDIVKRAVFKLKLSSYSRLKYLKMKALAYFGVTVKDIKKVFGISANYARIPESKGFYTSNICTEEEIAEVRKTLDRLIYLLWLFRYVKFDENGIVLKEYKDYNKNRICELYVRTTLFYFSKRYKKLFGDTTDRPTVALCKFLDINASELTFINQKLHTFNLVNLGEMRSLLYYAFGISLVDAKEMLQYKQPSLQYIHQKYADRLYNAVLTENEFTIIKKFLRNIYENTKYISYLKGVDKNER